MTYPFFTIGHSTRSLEELVALLQESEVELLVDVRTVPRSRTNPQFNMDGMAASLAPFDIAYEHMASLGGLRGKSKTVPRDTNGFWNNDSFHNYADYAMSDEFHQGLEELIAKGRKHRAAIMCSEAVWWRCHRRIVTDWLLAGGEKVFHIMGLENVDPATPTKGAVLHKDGSVTYPENAEKD